MVPQKTVNPANGAFRNTARTQLQRLTRSMSPFTSDAPWRNIRLTNKAGAALTALVASQTPPSGQILGSTIHHMKLEMFFNGRNMTKPLYFAFVFGSIANIAMAQDVPPAVIDQCQGSVSANELPECLREGAVGYILLDRATQADYFGSAAERVVIICSEQNETFSSAWTCVAEAADDAVETARLIGRDAIADTCIRALADTDIVERLDQDRSDLRSLYSPHATFFGGTMYRPFLGCPSVTAEESAVEGGSDEDTDFSAAECVAFLAFDQFVASKSADELRAILPALESLPEEERLEALEDFGLSSDAIETIVQHMDRSDNDALGLAMLGAGLLGRHHPDLLEEAFTLAQPDNEMASAFAAGLIEVMSSAAMQRYESVCPQ